MPNLTLCNILTVNSTFVVCMCVVRKSENTPGSRQHFCFKMFSWQIVPACVVVINYEHNSQVMQEAEVKFSVDLLQ